MTGRPKQNLLPQAGPATRRISGMQRDGVHLAPDAALLIRSDGTIADLNLYAEELFGYARAELLGRELSLLMPERFRKAHAHHFTAYRGDARPRSMGSGMDLWGLRKDGSEFPVDIALTPRQMPEGLHVVCNIRDLSSRLDRAIDEQLRFQTLIADISARFVNLPQDRVDSEIECALQRIVDYLEVDRSSFARFSPDDGTLRVTHSYAVPSTPTAKSMNVDEQLPWFAAQLRRGEIMRFEHLPDALPTEAEAERAYVAASGIKAVMTIPIKMGGVVAYVLSVGSFRASRKWPGETAQRIQLLGEIFASAIVRRQLQRELEEQLAFEKLVADISARFASLAMEDIDAEITRALQQITKFLGVDQAACLKFSSEQGTLVSTHFYNAPGVTAPPPPLVLHLQYPWYTSKVRRGETIRMESLPDDLPSEAVNEKEFVTAKGMRAQLAIPIKVTDSVTFVLAVLSFRSPRPWPDAVVQRLQLLGEIFAGALQRKRALLALQESEAKFRLLAETATCGIGIYQDGRFQYVSPRATEITGYSMDEMLSISIDQLVHPDSRAQVLDRTERRLRGEAVPARYEIKILTKQGEERWVDFTAAVTQYRGKPAIIGTAFDVTQQRHAQEALQELGGRLIRAQEDERAHVARELHDDLSQRLALLAIELEQAGQQIAKSIPSDAATLQGLWEQTREIGTDLHRISRQLHPSQLEALGLVSALRSFCAEFSKQKGIRIEFTHDGILRELPDDVTLCLYRIVQESLLNASQHGRAQHIDINLVGTPEAIRLKVVDDGVGFDVAAQGNGSGLGLVSMRERARLVRGDFSIRSAPNQGTRIEVRVPLAGQTL